MLASVLGTERRVGLFTSPHLVHVNERIQVAGHPVPMDALAGRAARFRDEVRAAGASLFEALTALAFLTFAEERVDVAVVEVGLGGRLDATNVVHPEVTIITNVGMDHAEYLGTTVEAIAAEKAGILKPGVPAVTAATDARVVEVLRRAAEERGTPLRTVGAGDVHVVGEGPGGSSAAMETLWGPLEFQVPLPGPHQILNAAAAVRALEALHAPLRPERQTVLEGLARTHWPGRAQRVDAAGGRWLLDVAHNPAGVEALLRTARSTGLPRPWTVLCGILEDKDWPAMVTRLAERSDRLILTVPRSAPPARRWDPAEAAGRAPADCRVEVIRAFDAAMEEAAKVREGTVFVTGSVHTVGDALVWLGIHPFPGEPQEESD